MKGGAVINFIITPDSKNVVYQADQEVDERRELYIVPLKLSGSMVSGGNVSAFLVDKDNTRVVFTADRLTNESTELFSVLLTGGTITKLSPPVGPGDVFSVQIDPASKRVVFLLDDHNTSVPKHFGSAASAWVITADSQRILYSVARTDYGTDLFSQQIFGGGLRNLSDTGGSYAFNPVISPDDQWIVFDLQAIGPASGHVVLGNELRLSDGKAAHQHQRGRSCQRRPAHAP